MKKGMAVLVAAALFFGVASEVQAQAFGVRAGANFATLSGEAVDDLNPESRTGLVGGVFMNLNPAGFWSIQPEVLFSQMGATADEGGSEVEFKLNYIQVPVLARVNFAGTAGGFRPHFLIGPAVAFNLSCDVSGEDSGVSVELDCADIEIDVKKFEFAAVFGAGVGMPVGPGEFTVDGRLYQGLTNIADSDDENDEAKNEAWQILAGFSFPFGMR